MAVLRRFQYSSLDTRVADLQTALASHSHSDVRLRSEVAAVTELMAGTVMIVEKVQ